MLLLLCWSHPNGFWESQICWFQCGALFGVIQYLFGFVGLFWGGQPVPNLVPNNGYTLPESGTNLPSCSLWNLYLAFYFSEKKIKAIIPPTQHCSLNLNGGPGNTGNLRKPQRPCLSKHTRQTELAATVSEEVLDIMFQWIPETLYPVQTETILKGILWREQ